MEVEDVQTKNKCSNEQFHPKLLKLIFPCATEGTILIQQPTSQSFPTVWLIEQHSCQKPFTGYLEYKLWSTL